MRSATSDPGPGRLLVQHRARRRRHHQQDPARLNDRTARRCELLGEPGQLRPGPPPRQRAHNPSTGPQPLPSHQRRPGIRDLRHPGPRACCNTCSPPTSRRQLHQRYERPCTPSAFTSHNASTMPGGCPQQPGTSDNSQSTTHQGSLPTKVRYATCGTCKTTVFSPLAGVTGRIRRTLSTRGRQRNGSGRHRSRPAPGRSPASPGRETGDDRGARVVHKMGDTASASSSAAAQAGNAAARPAGCPSLTPTGGCAGR